MAAAMSLAGGKKGRRTAVESLAAVGITSFLANLVAKGLFRRRRPTDPVPEARTSTDAGFVLDALRPHRICRCVRSRRGRGISGLRIPLNALAAAIGFSRVYTGVHHPTDVISGGSSGQGSERSPSGRCRIP